MSRIVVGFVRSYARWTHRRHAKVYYPELADVGLQEQDVIDISQLNLKQPKIEKHKVENEPTATKKEPRSSLSRPIVLRDVRTSFNFGKIDKITFKHKKVDPNEVFMSENNEEEEQEQSDKLENVASKKAVKKVPIERCFDGKGKLLYRKLPDHDIAVGKLLINLKSKKERGKCGLILVEGWRMVVDGLLAGCKLEKLIFSDALDLEKIAPYMPEIGPEVCKMPYREFKIWSNVDTPPGIMGIFKAPSAAKLKLSSKNVLPLNIVCDNIRDPGNMGSILRAASGIGCQNVFLTKGCVDIWDPKVLRSGSGAHFRIPVYPNMTWDDISNKCQKETSIFIADNNLKCDQTERNISVETTMFYEANRIGKASESFMNSKMEAESEFKKMYIPIFPYYEMDYSDTKSIMLIVGGETEGLSDECYKFGFEKNGVRINIPLTDGVDSLNAGMAFAIIGFEIKKQILSSSLDSDRHKNSENSVIS